MDDKKMFSKEQIISFLSKQEYPVSIIQILDHFCDVKERRERAKLYRSLLKILNEMYCDQIIDHLLFGSRKGNLYYLRKSSKEVSSKPLAKAKNKVHPAISIALVDSNVLFRKSLMLLFSSWKDVETSIDVDDGKLLIQKLNKTTTVPDICIMSSPAMLSDNGETLKRLRNDFPSIRILILASYYDEFTIRKIINDGASGYLTKQCSPEELEKAVYSLHKGKFYWKKVPKNLKDEAMRQKSNDLELTEKQLLFLSLCSSNILYEEMSERMGLRIRTLDNYRDSLFKIFGVNNRLNLVLRAIKAGVTEIK